MRNISVKIKKFGNPKDSIFLDDTSNNITITENELLINILLFPINPADLLLIEGRYGNKPNLPSLIGSECVAVVNKIGKKVKNIKEGDIVMPITRCNWTSKKVVHYKEVIKLKIKTNLEQACMLKVNPATAYLMLNNFITINKHDYILQNASNSAVGNYIIQLCKYYEIYNINLVRRNELIKNLYDIGATKVFNSNNIDEALNFLHDIDLKLFIDAVAGKQVNTIVSALKKKTTIINYGLLSGKNIELDPYNIIFKEIQLKGFWLSIWLEKMSLIERNNLYKHLEELIISNVIYTKVEKIYDISNIFKALQHSKEYKRDGKILVTPNYKLLKKFIPNNQLTKLDF